jgi:hypothetical protein
MILIPFLSRFNFQHAVKEKMEDYQQLPMEPSPLTSNSLTKPNKKASLVTTVSSLITRTAKSS